MPFKLPEHVVDKLLDKLSSDDDFRELFQNDPRKALEEAGYVPTPGNEISDTEIGGMKSQPLANKDDIKASRELIRKKLLTEQACKGSVGVNLQKPLK